MKTKNSVSTAPPPSRHQKIQSKKRRHVKPIKNLGYTAGIPSITREGREEIQKKLEKDTQRLVRIALEFTGEKRKILSSKDVHAAAQFLGKDVI